MSYDSRPDTQAHIQRVRELIGAVRTALGRRSAEHDYTKLIEPELSLFNEWTPKLAALTYGSDEYTAALAALKPALDHHYAAHGHHPEHWPIPESDEIESLKADIADLEKYAADSGAGLRTIARLKQTLASMESRVNGMSLLDVIEMLADHKAAGERHADGDIWKSMEINRKRFGYSDQLYEILCNTIRELGWA